MGIGFIIKDEILEELKSGKVIEIDIQDAIIEKTIGAITLKEELQTFATKKLIEYMKKSNEKNE